MSRDRVGFPVPVAPIVGRERELQALSEKLQQGYRLITIVGGPGVGKTRVSLELAKVQELVPMKLVAYCDLRAVHSREELLVAVASTLAIDLANDPDKSRRIGDALAGRGSLFLLADNFEQLVRPASDVVSEWLHAAPELRIVITSREPLRVPGESAFRLEPLSTTATDLEMSDAAKLWVARAASRGVIVEPAAAPIVEVIVDRLDGIPLAIECAAAHVGVLGVQKLARMLPERALTLSADGASADPRHDTLRAAIGWSWELLTDAEQTCLAQLTLFEGGFESESAERVVELPTHDRVAEVLGSLRDKSLIHPVADGRLSMFESVRAFAAEALDERTRVAVQRRLLLHFAELGEQCRRAIRDPSSVTDARIQDEVGAIEILTAERSNLRAALRIGVATAEAPPEIVQPLVEVALALDTLMRVRGPLSGRLEVLHACGKARGAGRRSRAELALARAAAHRVRRELEDATKATETARALAISMDDPSLAARADTELALLALERGHLAKAAERLRELRERETTDARIAELEGLLGIVAAMSGDIAAAASLFEKACRASKRARGRLVEAVHRCNLALSFIDLGHGDAVAEARRAEALALALGDRSTEGRARRLLGLALWEAGDPEGACSAIEDAVAIFRAVGAHRFEATALLDLVDVRHEQGELERARELAKEAVELLLEGGGLAQLAMALGSLGSLEARLDGPDRATRTFEEAERALADFDNPVFRMELALRTAFCRLGDEASLLPMLDEAATVGAMSQRVRAVSNILRRTMAQSSGLRVTVGPAGAWLSGGKSAVPISELSVRRTLTALVDAHRRAPGSALTSNALAEAAGCTSSEMIAPAGTLDRLREAGLQGALLEQSDGFLLDPTVRVEVSSMASDRLDGEPQAASADDVIRVGAAGAWVRLPDGRHIGLGRRRVLRHLLRSLVEHRLEHPGATATREHLIDAAWPHDRSTPESQGVRLRVAIAALRRLGLKEWLQTHEGGYLLSPAIDVIVEPPEQV